MFRKHLNELHLTLTLRPAAPLLIKAGEDPATVLETTPRAESRDLRFGELTSQAYTEIEKRTDAERTRRQAQKQQRANERGNTQNQAAKLEADMRFVTTLRDGVEQPYLPGSSLKGVLRSRCEQLAVTFLPAGQVCNLFHEDDGADGQSCTKRVEAQAESALRYRTACTVCKLFGCGGLAGRLAIGDAYLMASHRMGLRNGVGIDRRRGAAASGALFQYEVLEAGEFQLSLTLDNFELWQVGLVAYALDALFQADLPIGYGTRRGLGCVQGEVSAATLNYFSLSSRAEQRCLLRGAYALSTTHDQQQYRLLAEADAVTLPQAQRTVQGLRQSWTLGAEDMETVWAAGAQAWQDYITKAAEEAV